ncbi:MAG TPA: glycosyltransferase family 9 protein [Planctomycetaceae bacterium]|nr:glycosyltransferase family 9 protein [Planctomycetaceae bacterium]
MPSCFADARPRPSCDDVRTVGLFRALQLGDLLCAVPAARALKRRWPHWRISLIGLPWAAEFARRFSAYFDGFIEFPGFPGLPEREPDLRAIPEFFQRMDHERFDLIIQMHGSGHLVNSLCALMRPKSLAGYYLPGDFCSGASDFIPYPSDRHEIQRHLLLVQSLGAEDDDESLEFPLEPRDSADLATSLRGRRLTRGRYVCIHPGARYESRRWLPERFAAVARELAEAGYEIVLTGSRDEIGLAKNVADQAHCRTLNLAGRTTLGAFAALIADSGLVITNDTGTSHVASALKTPSIVIVLGSDAARWGPRDSARHRIASAAVPCRPCEHRTCPIGFECANGLSWRTVADGAKQLLDSSRASLSPRQRIAELVNGALA